MEENYVKFISATITGQFEVINSILKDTNFDPSTKNNELICWTSSNGYLEVVDRLLDDKRIDPSARNNYSIKNILTNKCIYTKLLYSLSLVVDTDLKQAIILEKFLFDKRVYTSLDINTKKEILINCYKRNIQVLLSLYSNSFLSNIKESTISSTILSYLFPFSQRQFHLISEIIRRVQ